MSTKETTEAKTKALQEARDLINQEISDYRTKLEALTLCDQSQLDPIMIDGETTAGYQVRLFDTPGDAARIMLKYDWPVYRTLGEDAPDEMWEELGRHYGLETVCSIDL